MDSPATWNGGLNRGQRTEACIDSGAEWLDPPPATRSCHPPPEATASTFALLHAASPHLHLCTFSAPSYGGLRYPYTLYSILSSPSLPDIVEDEYFFEYIGQEGDELLMRRLVEILLLEGFL